MLPRRPGKPFHACIDLVTMAEDESILAYERNGQPVDIHLGGLARMRVGSNPGDKHV